MWAIILQGLLYPMYVMYLVFLSCLFRLLSYMIQGYGRTLGISLCFARDLHQWREKPQWTWVNLPTAQVSQCWLGGERWGGFGGDSLGPGLVHTQVCVWRGRGGEERTGAGKRRPWAKLSCTRILIRRRGQRRRQNSIRREGVWKHMWWNLKAFAQQRKL